MDNTAIKTYGYRWIVLAVFAVLNAVVQLNWITFAPITVDCMALYHTSAFWIVLLSMVYMVVYLFVSIPASYIIDRYGIRVGVGIGAAITGVFGLLRGIFGDDYTMVALCQFALAVAQPFVMNAITKVSAEWFPINERATATGVTMLAQFAGIIVAMALTKVIAQSYMAGDGTGRLTMEAVRGVLLLYGYASLAAGALFIILGKEKPATPPCRADEVERYGVFEGLGHIFRHRDMILLLIIFFIGMGMFNAISTFIDLILASKGYVAGGNEAGNVGAAMMVAGIIGAAVIPPISDKLRKRKIFFLICMFGTVPGLTVLTFATGYVPLLISSAVFGFFFMAAAPMGYQYAAEVSYPAPESTSQGMIALAGQISGSIFIVLMALFSNITIEALANANLASNITLKPFMILFIILSVINIAMGLMVKESAMIQKEQG